MQLAAVLAALVAGASAAAGSPFDGWEPHRYCNDLEGIGASRVPPLRADQAARVESLEQVQVLSRHGARAPYARLFCWDAKRHNPMNAEWSCTTTSVSSQNIDFPKSSKGYGRLYRKSYLDGLNILDGTCEIGGLLPLGRQQQLLNGEFLRDAYVGDGPLKIFSTTDLSDVALDDIYLRSDDEERTLGSGQAMVDGIFPPDDSVSSDLGRLLTWHVADYATDYIDTNERGCPMLGLISNISYGSNTFQEHIRQPETVALTDHFNKLVGNFSWSSVLECLSVARCSGLALPDGVDEKTFTEVFHEVEVRQGLYYTNNDSQVSKFAMQPLAHEFVKRIDKVVDGAKDAPKLSITMAHDSTIMPFLAAVQREKWDRLWTPYAGMLIIELYKTKSLSFAARLIFHGEVLEIPECGDTLCDIEDFLKAFEFARQPRNCTLPKHDKNESAHLALTAPQESDVSLYLSIFLVVGLVVVAAGVVVRVIGGRKRRNQEELSLLP